MRAVGNITRTGCTRVARAVLLETIEHGQVAVFVGKNGEAATVAHYESGARDTINSRLANLVGVYRYDEAMAEKDFLETAPAVAFDIFATYKGLPHVRTIRRPVNASGKPRRRAGALPVCARADQENEEMRDARAVGPSVRAEGQERGAGAGQRLLEVRERSAEEVRGQADVREHKPVAGWAE